MNVVVSLRRRWVSVMVLLTLVATVFIGFISGSPSHVAHAASPINGLHIAGNHILNSSGQVFVPHGVDRAGTEYICVNSSSVFDGPSDAASVAAIASWGVNTVRVPLNEDCWLGINGLPSGSSASNYQQQIINYVNLLNANNIAVILDLHWAAAGGQQSTGQDLMPDADHAGAFWTSVANTFKNNSSVIFDLYNEPHPASWSCWLNGSYGANQSPCGDVGFAVAGMQSMVNAVRSTGATNILMAGGLTWSNDLSQWLQNKPNDPQNNLAASWHLYNFNGCNNTGCWDSQVAPVAAQVPVITGELGENDCASGFVTSAMNWDDQHGVGYLGWAWNPYDCGGFPSLITNYDGTPTAFGQGIKDHLLSLAPPPPPLTPDANGAININAGGSATSGFYADGDYSGGQTGSTTNAIDTSAVTNPAPQAVYQTERYGNFTYNVANLKANAAYNVRLHFSEFYFTSAGQRTFNVSINGSQVISNFDIFASAGGANKAIVKQFSASADASGTIQLQFSSIINNAKIDGIEVTPAGSPTPTPTPSTTPTPTPTPSTTPTPTPTPTPGQSIAINAGGGAVGGFVADTDGSGGTTVSSTNTIDTSAVTNPAPQAVYQTERYGNFTYTIPHLTANAAYTVRLHFAEVYFTSAGQRSFNVSINGTQVMSNFDIFAAAGGENKAIIEQFNTKADGSGTVTIQFTSVVNNAKIDGIEVTANTSGAVAINTGGNTVGSFGTDVGASGGTTVSSTNIIDTSAVTNPAPQAIYQTERYGNFTYTIPHLTANAAYTVRLHFAEVYFTSAGQRSFNVSINGTQVMSNFDIFAAAGGENKAIVKQFTTKADGSGTVTIQFTSVINNAKICGIEVIPQ
ncbi:malectin domain-containing carbohydrate-binding protein [Dictyobacter kobayashii]|uniref:Malectin domain-containing protein n=1 Tax=Dictyobacter kobayashii TaxID=2014872 RepID=A0A402AJ69_9CHLR|nr:malectin domain-containing carbohydrate-binding protein [Dictyobacter kobayashii]GCE19113.1 hypothetical protein KDK_29130 [Dictyobacter kobayashii]